MSPGGAGTHRPYLSAAAGLCRWRPPEHGQGRVAADGDRLEPEAADQRAEVFVQEEGDTVPARPERLRDPDERVDVAGAAEGDEEDVHGSTSGRGPEISTTAPRHTTVVDVSRYGQGT